MTKPGLSVVKVVFLPKMFTQNLQVWGCDIILSERQPVLWEDEAGGVFLLSLMVEGDIVLNVRVCVSKTHVYFWT